MIKVLGGAVLCVDAGQWSADESMCYSTYKLFLCHISSVFQGVRMRWNADYDKVRARPHDLNFSCHVVVKPLRHTGSRSPCSCCSNSSHLDSCCMPDPAA